ncbi:SusC/RagA family TonB-linked outer membrane protein [Arachidicoccus terrestris]|uniref:SusC/RagA family TonB-linked outer membrane protein n=1 Tax=Arachidicoccus terrestris TaxID=2875539 RepID=UPI001CC53396|nr:SusC/RagA family TonB-linked outer membrane protein [Arachidicoccus terrestris]UAY56972.1 SusC/RagA family TonB-linked outer membrane protein [Arachidicoccus terrestris]
MVKLCSSLLLFLLLLSAGAYAQNSVSGIVRSSSKEVLSGASVSVINTQTGNKRSAVTNESGIFKFTDLPVGGPYSFIVSYVGMKSDTLTGYMVKEHSKIALSVILHDQASSLSDLIVIGYGKERREDLSSAVATVNDIAKVKERPVMDVQNMLQGQVPGVTVVANGGSPTNTPSVTIRGVGSKGAENVLYVVDGVPNAPYNPSDVTSITVLKDAASAAIYGAFAGSAGVILITTKQATEGKTSVSYDGFVGIKNAWRTPQSLTAAQQAMVSNLADKNAGLPLLDGWDSTRNPDVFQTRTDWIGSVFRTGITNRNTITINSGTDKFSSLFQAREENNQGTLLNTYNKNISLRYSGKYTFNDHFTFKQQVFWNNNDSRGTETSSGYSGVILSAIYMPRSATVYYPDGSFGGVGPRNSPYLGIFGDAINPVGTLLRNQAYNKTTNILSVSELDVNKIFPGLDFLSRFSYNQSNWLNKNFTPARTEPGKPNDQNSLAYATDKNFNWIWENTLNYNKSFNKHRIGLMASTTIQEYSDRGFGTAARGFNNEADWAQYFVNAGIFDQDHPTDYYINDRNLSYVGRASYSWNNRYFMTASYRYDKADRLASGYRGKGFPGLTAAWKLSSEPFFNVKGIDLLKFRASWGRIGNISSVGYYYGYPALTQNTVYQIGNESPLSNGLYLASAFNPQLSWETSQQTDIGIDLSFLNNRLAITGDYFNKETFDLIQQQTSGWPSTYGVSAPLINQGKIRNTGFEFSGQWHDKIGQVGYSIGGNIATLKNRVIYIDGNPGSVWTHGDSWRSGLIRPYQSTVGQPYYSYWLIKTDGIFQTDEQAENYVAGNGNRIQPFAKAGDLKFVDNNDDGVIDDNDRVFMGAAFPKLTYAFNFNVSYKKFDLSLFFQGVGGVKLFNAFKESTLNASEQGYNRWDKILDAWSPTNTGSNIPIISASDNNKNFATPSDWYLESGDFLRLKNLSLAYTFTLPRDIHLKVYFSGDNLLTFTKYSGMDPEVGGIGLDGGQYPVSRVFSFGVNLKF